MWRDTFTQFEQFGTNPKRLKVRALVLLFTGASLAFASVFNPNATLMHAREFSWLPATGWILLAVGLLECFDAAIAKESRDFFLHLPTGLLDIIVGGLTIFSISGDPSRLNLMIAAFLMTKGMMRLVISHGTSAKPRTSILAGAWASIVLGIVIGIAWPLAPAWFLSLCLSGDIALRGWSLRFFAAWVQEQQAAAN
jgi:uncharacterized membrane protein HdeD (DUF308 family)